MTMLSPNNTANAHSAAKLGLYAYCELQASTGTQPFSSGTAVVQLAVGILDVDVGEPPMVAVAVDITAPTICEETT